MTLLDSGLDLGVEEESQYLMEFGEKLKTSIHNFNLDFIPHMEEEEQVKWSWINNRKKWVKARKKGKVVMEEEQVKDGVKYGVKGEGTWVESWWKIRVRKKLVKGDKHGKTGKG